MELDPRMTFDAFVVGPANRLAFAAAKRAAESPGTGFNPLFLYSASGLGKSHILSAISHHGARALNPRRVVYQTLEGYLDELTHALEAGDQESVRDRYRELDILLLDDVQFLTGQNQAQEMLLRTLDTLTAQGAQVVLASDRPPAEIDGLDARLLSRFSGGLIVDIGQPDYETRVAILRRKAEERGGGLNPGVAEVMSRHPFRNVRELQGALNRLLAIQELEGRTVTPEELPQVMGMGFSTPPGEGLSDPVTPEPLPEPAEPAWVLELRHEAESAERRGMDARRLRRLLESEAEPDDWEGQLQRFRADLDRMEGVRGELDALGNPWPEAATSLLRDPDRLEEAESLLASARERARPFPELGEGSTLDGVKTRHSPLAIRAAERILLSEHPDYNPLYLHARSPARVRELLEAAGRSFLLSHPEGKVGYISVPDFAEEFIRAISDGVAGAWRERWWTVEVLLLYGVEALSSTERAQDEFFHLFEALKRRGARIVLGADRPPAAVQGVDDRLRSRFEGGLVVELGEEPETAPVDEKPAPAAAPSPSAPPVVDDTPGEDDLEAIRTLLLGAKVSESGKGGEPAETHPPTGVPELPKGAGETRRGERWFPEKERIVWEWPRVEDRIVEEEGSDGH